MHRHTILRVVSMFLIGLVGVSGCFAAEADTAKVTLQVTDVSVSSALNSITEQTGIQIYFEGNPAQTISVSVEDVTVEEAVHTVAKAANCSWIRTYLFEPKTGELEPLSFGSLLKAVRTTRQAYWSRLNEEQKAQLKQEVSQYLSDAEKRRAEAAEAGKRGDEQCPIGGWRANTGSADGEISNADDVARWALSDPLRSVAQTWYFEPASILLEKGSIEAFTDEVTYMSNFAVVNRLGDEATGTVSLDMEDADVDEIVGEGAKQIDCTWRRVYLMAHVNQLTDDEMSKKVDALFTAGVGYFWSQPAEKRAEMVKKVIAEADKLTPEQRRQIGSSQVAKQFFAKALGYSNTLPMDQRKELMPLLQEAARLLGR